MVSAVMKCRTLKHSIFIHNFSHCEHVVLEKKNLRGEQQIEQMVLTDLDFGIMESVSGMRSSWLKVESYLFGTWENVSACELTVYMKAGSHD